MFLLLGVRFMLEKAMPLIIITLRYANNIAPEPEIIYQGKFSLAHYKKGSCIMLLQDVPVKNSSKRPNVIFNNRLELTLISRFFAKLWIS